MQELGPEEREEDARAFWDLARFHSGLNAAPGYFGPTTLESVPPPTWSFGDNPAEADDFVADVLAGDATSVSTPVADYAAAQEPLPKVGVLSILCDGRGAARALLETSAIEVTGDLLVESFRVVHVRS
jgi:hypothetical protein